MSRKSTYLSDGAYASDDGFHIILTTGSHEESDADNVVYLDGQALDALLCFIEKSRGLKITVEKAEGRENG